MSDYYMLDKDKNIISVDDVLEWGRFFQDIEQRRVARDEHGDICVSTVFLGLDYGFGDGPPLLFETLISGGEHNKKMWRYSAWDEAVEGHAAVCLLAFGESPRRKRRKDER